MPVREGPPQPAPPPPSRQRRMNKMRPVDGPAYSGEKARGGEIILRTPARRMIFIAGLVGIIVLVLLLRFLA